MSARAFRRGVIAARASRSKLVIMAQAVKPPYWFNNDPNHMAAYPWDGFVFIPDQYYDVHSSVATVSASTVSTSMGTFHSQTFPSAVTPAMVDNYALIRIFGPTTDLPWWNNDTHWALASANYGAFAEGVKGANCKGIFIDNEFYGTGPERPFDWAGQTNILADAGETYDSGSRDPTTAPAFGITPSMTLANARAKVYQRGQEAMAAMIAVWPDIRVVHLHSPVTSSVLSGQVMSGTCGDPTWPWHNQVSYFTELKAAFFGGMAAVAHGTRARVIDGGEKYEMQNKSQVQKYHEWRTAGIRASDTAAYSNASVLSTYYATVGMAQGLAEMDSCDGVASAAHMKDQIMWSLRSQKLVWEYIESWDVHADPDDPDPPPSGAYVTAMTEGRALGRGAG